MTGITKDELMQMASDAQAVYATTTGLYPLSPNQLEHLANAILERAAVECEDIESIFHHGDGASAAEWCATKIRALKINIGD